mgnify:CR=1 FL=1
MKQLIIAKKLLIFIILAGASLAAAQTESRLTALAPEEFGNGEWTRHRQAEIYQGDDLFLYINGGAEIYHEYGFKQVLLQDYISSDGKSGERVRHLYFSGKPLRGKSGCGKPREDGRILYFTKEFQYSLCLSADRYTAAALIPV